MCQDDGIELDTGGALVKYWQFLDKISQERHMEATDAGGQGCMSMCWLDRGSVGDDDNCFGGDWTEVLSRPDLWAGALMHARRSSGWDSRHEKGYKLERLEWAHRERLRCIEEYLGLPEGFSNTQHR